MPLNVAAANVGESVVLTFWFIAYNSFAPWPVSRVVATIGPSTVTAREYRDTETVPPLRTTTQFSTRTPASYSAFCAASHVPLLLESVGVKLPPVPATRWI